MCATACPRCIATSSPCSAIGGIRRRSGIAKRSRPGAQLIAYATPEHDILIREAHADNLIRRAGYRALFRDAAALDDSIKAAEEDRREFGVNFRVLSGSELTKAEPILRDDLPGAIHWLDTWTVSDPGALVTAYANLFERLGGTHRARRRAVAAADRDRMVGQTPTMAASMPPTPS